MSNFLGMKLITSPLLEPGVAYLIDEKALIPEFEPFKIRFRADHLESEEYDVNKVPEFHLPVRLVTHKVDLLPEDRFRLNNQLIDIFGTRPVVRFMPRFSLRLKR